METVTIVSSRGFVLTDTEILVIGVIAAAIIAWQLLVRLRPSRNR
ncbi:MAG: hypothetical protein DIU56_007395 [Pseudomonadota bacterium]|jgi:hypothetical protein